MFRYALHSSTRQNIQSHCFYSPVFRPSRNYRFNNPQNKISISVNPWVFSYPSNADSSNCCPFLGQHSLRVFRSLKSLTGKNRLYDALLFLGETTEPEFEQWPYNTDTVSSLVHSSLKVHCSYRLKFLVV